MKRASNPTIQAMRISIFAFAASFAAPPAIAAAIEHGYLQLAAASKSAAAEEARSQYGGKVLKVEEVSEGGRKVFRVKLLLDGGRIKIVTVDTGNG